MSEFGKGLSYCLGLFLAHANPHWWDYKQISYKKMGIDLNESHEVAMWFNAASDHLYDMEIDSAPKHLRGRLRKLAGKAIDIGHGSYLFSDKEKTLTKKDMEACISEAKELLRLLDKHYKIKTEKADFA